MNLKNRSLTILLAFLLMGAGLAQAEGDDPSAARQECEDRYHKDLAEAEADYQDAKEEAARDDSSASTNGSDQNDDMARAEEQYQHDKAEAEARYKECLADAEHDQSAEDAAHDGAAKDAPADDPRASECRAEYEHDLAEAEQEYHDDMADAKEDGDADKEREAMAEYEESKADAKADYADCLRDHEDEHRIDLPLSFEGKHVSFELTRTGFSDYSVDDQDILADVSIHTTVGWDEFERHGAAVKAEGDLAEFKAADNPTGVMRFETEHDKRVYITFADGVEAVRYSEIDDRHQDRNGSVVEGRLLLQGDGFEAFLWVDKGYVEEERGIIAAGEFRLAMVQSDRSDRAHDSRTADAIADGRLAVEVDLYRDGEVRGAEYGDVNITFGNQTGSLVAIVEGHGEGKTILFNLEEGSYDSLDGLEVLYDGEAIGFADNLEDVLDVSDGVAEYIIIVGAEATQVLVQIPHFSVHTIQLQGANVGTASSTVTAVALVVGGGAAVAFVAVTMIGRSRRD